VKKAYQLSQEWEKLINKDTANKNLWDQVREAEVFSRKEFLDKVRYLHQCFSIVSVFFYLLICIFYFLSIFFFCLL
jgi:hypothetical protein